LRSFLKPDSSALLNHLLGRLHLQLGDADNAATQFELAVARFPDFRRAHKDLGFLHVREGRFEEAVRHLTRVIELGGADGNTFGLLGVAHLNRQKHLSAETAYRNAILYSPAVADWKLGLIKSLIEQGKYDESLALLDELLIENPGNERLWSIQGSVLLQKNEPARAAVNFEVLRKLGEADVKTLMLLGDIHLSREARALALEVYLEAMGKGGAEQLEATLRAAEVFTSLGAWEEAGELFAKAREVGGDDLPDETRLRLLKLESRVALATGAGEEALRVLEEIIEHNPLDGEALMLVGDYYAGIGEREMAELRFERAAKLEGFEADACVKHAQLLVQHQQYPKAIELLHRAQKLKPRDNIQRFLEAVERIAGSSSASNPVNS
jgi:Flp pilus assembly protein TadD